MFLYWEIDIKLYQIFTKIHINAILSKRCSIKQIIFNKYETNLKTIISHRSLRISGLLLLYFFNFNFTFWIDTIDNIITYSPYSPYYVTKITSANDSSVSLSRGTNRNHVTSILHFHWLKYWWHNMDYTD